MIVKKTVYQVLLWLFLLCSFFLFLLSFEKLLKNQQVSSNKESEIRSITEEMIQNCKRRSYKTQLCYDKQFFELTKETSVSTALLVLEELEKRDRRFNHCHSTAHIIADAEIGKDYTKWRTFLTTLKNPTICTRGFIHGTLEALLAYDPSFQVNPKYISELCYSLRDSIKGSSGSLECAHSMGHVFLIFFQNNVSKAVSLCKDLPNEFQFYCFDGIFMESILRDMLISHNLAKSLIPFTEESILLQENLCRRQTGLAAKACWKEISLMYVFITKYTPSKVWELCQRGTGADNQKECYLHSTFLSFDSGSLLQKAYPDLCKPFYSEKTSYIDCVNRIFYSANFESSVVRDNSITFCSVQPSDKKETCCTILQERVEKIVSKEVADRTEKTCNASI